MKDKILWAITYVAIGVLCLGACATEAEPVAITLLFGSMAWLLPFTTINRRRFK